jgi:hypothetical protein
MSLKISIKTHSFINKTFKLRCPCCLDEHTHTDKIACCDLCSAKLSRLNIAMRNKGFRIKYHCSEIGIGLCQ